jgi:iron complex outermembrane receptor protein
MLHTLSYSLARRKHFVSRKEFFSIFGAFLLSVLLCTDALADAYDEVEPDTVRLDTVKVTANKMEENLKDVPQSITVIGEVELEERGIQNIEDVIDAIPGMFITPNHGSGINFRGLNPSMFTDNNPVVMYIDGIPYSSKRGFDLAMVNVQRIEVLRGPQAALYGKDAMGAVINVITREPTNEWGGKANVEYGNLNKMLGQFMVNGPVQKDKLFVSLSGRYTQDDGWIKNDYPDMEEDANRERDMWVNGQVYFTPTERLKLRLSLVHAYKKQHWADEYALMGAHDLDDFNRDDAEHVRYEVPTWNDVETNAQSLAGSYEFDGFTLHSLTTHNNIHSRGDYDMDHSDTPMFLGLRMFDDAKVDSWGQELRVASNNSKGFRWTGGVYFDSEQRKQGPYGQEMPMYMGGQFLGNYNYDCKSTQHANTYAAFGQVMIPLWTDAFELTLGARYQRVQKDIDLSMYATPVGTTGPAAYTYEGDKTWDAFLPKAALTYIINENWTTYVSYSQGYMPGGFNTYASGGDEDDNTFEPEFSSNYEWGLKASYGSFSMAASVFYMDIKDIHVYKSEGNMYVTSNAERAHSQGAELEMKYAPWDRLELSTAMNVIEAKYDEFDTGTADLSDEDIEQTPSYSIRFGVAYHDPTGIYGRADVRHIGDVSYYRGSQEDFVTADPYTILDMKVGYRIEDWDIYAFAKNLTDEKYVNAFRSNSVFGVTGFGEPRTFGMGVMYYF